MSYVTVTGELTMLIERYVRTYWTNKSSIYNTLAPLVRHPLGEEYWSNRTTFIKRHDYYIQKLYTNARCTKIVGS